MLKPFSVARIVDSLTSKWSQCSITCSISSMSLNSSILIPYTVRNPITIRSFLYSYSEMTRVCKLGSIIHFSGTIVCTVAIRVLSASVYLPCAPTNNTLHRTEKEYTWTNSKIISTLPVNHIMSASSNFTTIQYLSIRRNFISFKSAITQNIPS